MNSNEGISLTSKKSISVLSIDFALSEKSGSICRMSMMPLYVSREEHATDSPRPIRRARYTARPYADWTWYPVVCDGVGEDRRVHTSGVVT